MKSMQEIKSPINLDDSEQLGQDISPENVFKDKWKWFLAGVALAVSVFIIIAGLFFSVLIKQGQLQPLMIDNELSSNKEGGDEENASNQDIEDEIIYYLNRETGDTIQENLHTLRTVGCCYFLDDNSQKIYYLENYLDENSVRLKHAPNVNFNDFSIYENDSRYAHDSVSVYAVLPVPFLGESSQDFGIIKEADPQTFEPQIVKQFDVSQGNFFQSFISRDKNHVYYRYDIFEHADPQSFVMTNYVSINKDRTNVYLWMKIVPGADPQTYEILRDMSAAGPGTVYGKDKNNFFIDYCMVSGVDTASVKVEFAPPNWEVRLSDMGGEFAIDYSEEQNTCLVIRE